MIFIKTYARAIGAIIIVALLAWAWHSIANHYTAKGETKVQKVFDQYKSDQAESIRLARQAVDKRLTEANAKLASASKPTTNPKLTEAIHALPKTPDCGVNPDIVRMLNDEN
jgi:uncharacterized membrane-anchored protein